MGKNILVISSSPRKGGNSETLACEFLRGALDAGNKAEIVYLRDKQIAFCKGCLACQKTLECVIGDDAVEITKKMLNADVIAFATPIYYYSLSGQLKTMLDRANALFASDYKFKDIYLIATAADSASSATDGAQNAIDGWISCFDGVSLKDVIQGLGLEKPGEAKKKPKLLKAAYNAGFNA